MELELTISQAQTLSPQVIQSLKVLQMNTQELLDFVRELAMENPVLELEAPPEEALPQRSEEIHRLEWLTSADPQNRWYHRQDASQEAQREKSGGATDFSATLEEYVLSQMPAATGELAQAIQLLTGCLDQNGWITESLAELSHESGLDEPLLRRALAQIQTAEPYGVGARNLQECLLLQLWHMPDADDLTAEIVREFLPELAQNHYNSIAKALGVPQEQVRRAVDQIRQLNPRPANGFAGREPTGYVIPDLIAVVEGGSWSFRASEQVMPRMHISDYYLTMSRQTDDPEVRQYLDEKLRQARWAMSAVTQRRDTMLQCMQAILELQPDYFRPVQGVLRPMTLADVADRVGVHESTVSRAIRGKYLQCPDGIVPLSFFFTQAACQGNGAEPVSTAEAKRRLQELILGEDARKPYSDQRLSELMEEKNCPISRRTVAKYRSEMGYPPATGRKRT